MMVGRACQARRGITIQPCFSNSQQTSKPHPHFQLSRRLQAEVSACLASPPTLDHIATSQSAFARFITAIHFRLFRGQKLELLDQELSLV